MDLLTLAVLATASLAGGSPGAAPSGPLLASRFAVPAPPPVPMRVSAPGPAPQLAPADTIVEYSAAYYRRLDIHRYGSYAMLPLFAFQFAAGAQLYDRSFEAPAWARTGHRVAATGVAALFTANTVTGVMNLWEGRRDPTDRGRKLFHASMMLLADAGFTATGLLAERAEGSMSDRTRHRTVALSSMAVATVGYLAMLDVFRRD